MESVSGVDAQAILRRMVERARFVAGDTNRPACVYTNTSRMETLDSSGVVKRAKEKIYEVTVVQGMTQNRVVAVDGRWLSADEIHAQSEKEKRWRDTYAGGKGGSPLERMDQLVNERLVQRFEYTVVGRERLRDRVCWVLDFHPRSADLPEERLMDRVINLLHGRLWIDMAEDEIVRADVHTEGTLRLWGGFLGSLETFQLHLDREKSAFDVWYNRHAEVTVRARKLFSLVHVRLREFGGGFRAMDEVSVR